MFKDVWGKHPPPPLLYIEGVRYPPSKNKRKGTTSLIKRPGDKTMAQKKLSEFINDVIAKYEADFDVEYANIFSHQDEEGKDFTTKVLGYKTPKTKLGFASDGVTQVEKPIFINISLSKAMSKEVSDDEFNTDWLIAHPNITVDVDPMYDYSAKIIKQGGRKVNKAKFMKAFNLA